MIALSNTVLTLNKQIVSLKAENKKLKEQVSERNKEIVCGIVQGAIEQTKVLPNERETLIELGTSNRKLFDKLMSDRAVVLSKQMYIPSQKDQEEKQKNQVVLSDKDKSIVAEAKKYIKKWNSI